MSLKYYPRLRLYKNYNGRNRFNPNTLSATSYGWWSYLKRINGKLVFNNYTYSNSTSKHQNHLRHLLKTLHVEPEMYIEAPEGLDDLQSAVSLYEYRITKLNALLHKPRTHKRKNLERVNEIEFYKTKIGEIKALIGNGETA